MIYLCLSRLVLFLDIYSYPCGFYSGSCYVPIWSDLCNSYDCETNSCPYYVCSTQPNIASPRSNTNVVLTLPDSSFPFGKCMGLKAGEPFRGVSRFSVIDVCLESVDSLDVVHNLVETPLGGLYIVFGCVDFPSLGDIVLPNLLDHSHVTYICSRPSVPPSSTLMCLLIIL